MFARIGDEVGERWPGARVAIAHRVGSLNPGDLAVVIAAAAAHRKEAFRACEYAIDRIKEDAPIWKREIYQDGAVWVGQHP
jgi:molybdopterin synthase catalytic subunit